MLDERTEGEETFRLGVEYDGTAFSGWQRQPRARPLAGVSGEQWSDPRFLDAPKLPPYEFLYCRKFGNRPAHVIERRKFPR